MGEGPILELRSVSAERDDFLVLDEVSFSLAEGEAAFFMGLAGSGKSALLKVAAGIQVASAGEILYRGRELSRMSRREDADFRRRTGFVFQDAALWANQSLYDNLALPLRAHERGIGAAELDRAVRRVAELVGYEEDLKVRPAELSSGERRLIGLARALVLDPELLFVDEPAANLDEDSAGRVWDIVAALRARGRSLLVASSSADAASRLADRVGVLRGGRLAAYGSLAEAAGWADPAIRRITGRLRPRESAAGPLWASGLAGAWVEAMAGGGEFAPAGAPGGPPSGTSSDAGPDDAALGDIINDVGGADEGREGSEEVDR